MGMIPKYTASVTCNDNDVAFTSASFTRTADNVAPNWSITLAEPIELSTDDVWTLERGFAGFSQVLVADGRTTGISGEDGVSSSTRTVQGRSEAANLIEYCVPQSLVFVNPTWLKQYDPTAKLIDGELYTIADTAYRTRLLHPRLPGKDVKSNDFTCIIGPTTHHAIARYLATLCGYDLVVNTPDLAIVDTFTVAKGSTWFDGIKKNFEIWQPNIFVSEGVIYILDILTDEPANMPPFDRVKITNAAILSVSETQEADKMGEVLDHLVVTGRSNQQRIVGSRTSVDLTATTIPEIKLDWNEEFRYQTDTGSVQRKKGKTHYAGPFNEADPDNQFNVELPKNTVRTDRYYAETISGKTERTLIQSVTETYLAGGTLQLRVIKTNRYGPNKKPIGNSETKEMLIRYPGLSSPVLEWVSSKHNIQDKVIDSLNKTLDQEIVEQLVVIDTGEDGSQHNDPVPVEEVYRADKNRTYIETASDTKQSVITMITNVKSNFISRVDENTLIQDTYDYDALTGHTKHSSQFLENPVNPPGQRNDEQPFSKDYYGTGKVIGTFGTCYHAPRTIQHDDITTEAVMDAIKLRAFARKGENQITLAIKTPVPIPFYHTNYIIELPDTIYTVNGVARTISGGDFFLRSVSERITYGTDATNQPAFSCEQVITVRSKF